MSSALPELLDRPDRLARYRVLYLAGIPYLSPERIANLRRYVEQGGALVASGSASLFDFSGVRQSRFALEELLGVRPLAPDDTLWRQIEDRVALTGGPNDLYLRARPGFCPALDRLGERLTPLWYYEPVRLVAGAGAEVAAEIVPGGEGTPWLPGLVLARHGKGRAVYLASGLESLYLGSNIAQAGQFVRAAVELAAPAPRPSRSRARPG